MVRDKSTQVIDSFKRFGSALKDDMNEVFFIAGVIAVTVGVSQQWGSPVGLIVLGTLLLLPVANKLR